MDNTFIEKAIKIHGEKYCYDKTVYTLSKNKVVITCPVHGDFEQRASNHLYGQGCNKCACDERIKNRSFSTKEFKEKSNNVHDSFYNYDKVEYVNSYTKVIITCPEHGDYEQKPFHHFLGKGCPGCAKGAFDTTKNGYLYIHLIKDSTKVIGYKVGITNREPLIRFNEINRASTFDHTMIFYVKGHGKVIKDLEKQIHKECGTIKGLHTNMKDGFTEVIPPTTINKALDLVFELRNTTNV